MTDIQSNQQLTRSEVAQYFRQFADQFDPNATDGNSADGQISGGTDTVGVEDSHADRSDHAETDDEANGQITGGTDTVDAEDSYADQSTHAETDDEATEREETTDVQDRVTFLVGNDSATVNPPREVAFQVDVGTDGGLVSGSDERHITFEMNWRVDDVPKEETLEIE